MDIEKNLYSINDLPDMTYLRIFEFIPTQQYKQLMFINKKFYELLQLPRFYQFLPRLTIRYCWLHPNREPWNFLINSDRKFLSIILAYPIKALPESEEFWRKIGLSTLELDLSECKNLPPNILSWFPNLRKLRVQDTEQLIGVNLPEYLHELYVKQHNFSQTLIRTNKFKNIRVLNSRSLRGLKSVDGKKMSPEFREIFNPELFESISIPTLNLLDLKQILPEEVHSISLHADTPLMQQLKIYSNFPNLRRLTVAQTTNSTCFFIHKILKLDLVWKFSLHFVLRRTMAKFCCNECCEFVIKSCPNISKIRVAEIPYHGALALVEKVAKTNKLKSLSFISWNNIPLQSIIFPSLTELKIWNLATIIYKDNESFPNILKVSLTNNMFSYFEYLLRSFPNVISAEIRTSLHEEHLKLAAKYWKNLKILKISHLMAYMGPFNYEIKSLAFKLIPSLLVLSIDGETTCRWMIEEEEKNEKAVLLS